MSTRSIFGLFIWIPLVVRGLRMSLPLGSPNKIIISPSVAKANQLALGNDLKQAVDGGAEWLHFSIQDGRMCPKISFGPPVVSACRDAFPNTVLDVKLTCIEPELRVADFTKIGADIISFHPEATLQPGAVVDRIIAGGSSAGVVLNPGTPVSMVEHLLEDCSVAVVMLVNPGYGGPKHMKAAISKIRELREIGPHLHISVDGGVSEKNASELISAGANVLVAGGGVFKADDKKAAIFSLKRVQYAPPL